MSIQSKLAARLREEYTHTKDCVEAYQPRKRMAPDCFACDVSMLALGIEEGEYNDILGMEEPTLEDVQREAVKRYGDDAKTIEHWDGIAVRDRRNQSRVVAPTLAAAYAALRTLPDYEGEK